jgi:hypothetical protein
MATAKNKAASTKGAAPKRVYFEVDKVKYELLGGPNKQYVFQGERFNKEKAGKNVEFLEALVKSGSPVAEKV